jgi:hypothetical protein
MIHGAEQQHSVSGASRFPNLVVLVTEPNATLQAVNVAERLGRAAAADLIVLAVQTRTPLPGGSEALSPADRELAALHARIRATARARLRVVVARNLLQALASLLPPESLVVIGGRRGRWWPTATSRLCRSIEGLGHYVLFVDEACHAA